MSKSLIAASLPIAILSMAGLTACDFGPSKQATISYSQLGACNGFTTESGSTAARPNSAFVIFKIESIDNTGSDTDFRFIPVRLYVDQAKPQQMFVPKQSYDQRFVLDDPRFTQGLGVAGTKPQVIAAGRKVEINGIVVVEVTTSTENGSAEAHETSYSLAYDSETGEVTFVDPSPDIVLIKSNAAQKTWPLTEDCLAQPQHLSFGSWDVHRNGRRMPEHPIGLG